MEEKKKYNYFFGDHLGRVMAKVDTRTQLEASMLSMALMMVGLVVTIVYLVIYTAFPLWYKIFLVLNLLAGLVFFWSNLVTQYQQYQNYMEVIDFTKNEEKENEFKEVN